MDNHCWPSRRSAGKRRARQSALGCPSSLMTFCSPLNLAYTWRNVLWWMLSLLHVHCLIVACLNWVTFSLPWQHLALQLLFFINLWYSCKAMLKWSLVICKWEGKFLRENICENLYLAISPNNIPVEMLKYVVRSFYCFIVCFSSLSFWATSIIDVSFPNTAGTLERMLFRHRHLISK